MGIDVEGHVVAIMHCPVGVDAERVGRDVYVAFPRSFVLLTILRRVGSVLGFNPGSRL